MNCEAIERSRRDTQLETRNYFPMVSFIKTPYLQWPTREAVTIMWETSSEATGEVVFYETARVHATGTGRFESVVASARIVQETSSPRCVHVVTLDGLLSGTSYHYQVRSGNDRGEQCESTMCPFRTAPEAQTPFSFSVTSETGGTCTDDYNREVFAQISRYRPDFLMMVGDAVCRGKNYDDWNRFFFEPGKQVLAQTPFYLVPGNHEENAAWYYDFTAFPEPKNYYAFRYGNTHFIGLDSTAIVPYKDGKPYLNEDDFGPGDPQHDFLIRELSASDEATWKIVFFHYPPYVSADYQVEEMRILCPILEKYGVDVVFNSHTIAYERSHPMRNNELDLMSGIVYIVAGGAGSRPEWFHHARAWHTAHALAVPHMVQVTIAGTRLEMQAIDYEGHLFDQMIIDKPTN